jgi:hypothetical protein
MSAQMIADKFIQRLAIRGFQHIQDAILIEQKVQVFLLAFSIHA